MGLPQIQPGLLAGALTGAAIAVSNERTGPVAKFAIGAFTLIAVEAAVQYGMGEGLSLNTGITSLASTGMVIGLAGSAFTHAGLMQGLNIKGQIKKNISDIEKNTSDIEKNAVETHSLMQSLSTEEQFALVNFTSTEKNAYLKGELNLIPNQKLYQTVKGKIHLAQTTEGRQFLASKTLKTVDEAKFFSPNSKLPVNEKSHAPDDEKTKKQTRKDVPAKWADNDNPFPQGYAPEAKAAEDDMIKTVAALKNEGQLLREPIRDKSEKLEAKKKALETQQGLLAKAEQVADRDAKPENVANFEAAQKTVERLTSEVASLGQEVEQLTADADKLNKKAGGLEQLANRALPFQDQVSLEEYAKAGDPEQDPKAKEFEDAEKKKKTPGYQACYAKIWTNNGRCKTTMTEPEVKAYEQAGGKWMRFSFHNDIIKHDQQGRALNPMGPTGVLDNPELGKYGANHAADLILIRVNTEGDIEILIVNRPEIGSAQALIGGFIDPSDADAEAAAFREAGEEALGKGATTEEGKAIYAVNKGIKDGIKARGTFTIHKGYVEDPRNSDLRWNETVAVAAVATMQEGQMIKPVYGDDARDAKWVKGTTLLGKNMYASHGKMVAKTMLDAKVQQKLFELYPQFADKIATQLSDAGVLAQRFGCFNSPAA